MAKAQEHPEPGCCRLPPHSREPKGPSPGPVSNPQFAGPWKPLAGDLASECLLAFSLTASRPKHEKPDELYLDDYPVNELQAPLLTSYTWDIHIRTWDKQVLFLTSCYANWGLRASSYPWPPSSLASPMIVRQESDKYSCFTWSMNLKKRHNGNSKAEPLEMMPKIHWQLTTRLFLALWRRL